MEADWSVECGPGDPTVVLPWVNASGSLSYLDLRGNPESIKNISEAAQFPALAFALERWNHLDSPVFTAKCDVWTYPADLFDAEDLPGFAFAQGSYVDLVSVAERSFADFPLCEAQLRRWTDLARTIPLPGARCEWTLRAAQIFNSLPLPANSLPANSLPADNRLAKPLPRTGFATTLYVWGYGATAPAAATAWSTALRALVEPVLGAANPAPQAGSLAPPLS